MNIAVALTGLLLSLSAPALATEWNWRAAATRIDLDFVRANVQIISRKGVPEIRVVPGGDDVAAVTFSAVEVDGVVRIRDRYPPRARWPGDCLPPVDERGDYWTHVVRLEVTILVPPQTRLRVRVTSGNIVTSAASGDFDLKSWDGVVR
jgi:hypothetical protein